MAGKLDRESRMAIKALKEPGSSASSIAQALEVTEAGCTRRNGALATGNKHQGGGNVTPLRAK
jgi:hypothetical protein